MEFKQGILSHVVVGLGGYLMGRLNGVRDRETQEVRENILLIKGRLEGAQKGYKMALDDLLVADKIGQQTYDKYMEFKEEDL